MPSPFSRTPFFRSARRLVSLAGLLLLPPGALRAEEPRTAGDYQHLASVEALDALLASFHELRNTILEDARSEREASEGMRFLLRSLAMSTDVAADGFPRAPHFARMDTQVRKVGGDNPDAEYDHLSLDGDHDYRITGNIGTVRHLSFTVMGNPVKGRRARIGYANERTLGAAPDGSFTLFLSRTRPRAQGLWIDTGAGLGSVLIRQYIGDRRREKLASYEIEVMDGEGEHLAPVSDAEIAQAIGVTRQSFLALSTLHRTVMPELMKRPNEFVRVNSDDFGADISGSDNLYMFGTFQIGPEEALVIETEPLPVRYWNLTFESPWHETVDYRKRRTHRTMDDVVVDPDGKVRFVVAQAATPYPNYIETAGHSRGWMTFRFVGERDTKAPLPVVKRVPLAQVGATLRSMQGKR